jgi:NAD(P)H dehydrogenase (quinone)
VLTKEYRLMHIFIVVLSWLNQNMSNNDEKPTKILIVFYSRYGNTARMAEEIAYGAKELSNIQVTIRRLADNISMEVISKDPAWTKIAEDLNNRYPTLPIEDVIKDLPNNDVIIFGSPTRFGNMAAPMKSMWDGTTELWTNGSLIGKIGAVFTSAASVHGGQETTAVSMMFPMFHHGMILIGVPYSVGELTESGSPYGPSRIVGRLANQEIEQADIKVARALGRRVADVTKKFVFGQLRL